MTHTKAHADTLCSSSVRQDQLRSQCPKSSLVIPCCYVKSPHSSRKETNYPIILTAGPYDSCTHTHRAEQTCWEPLSQSSAGAKPSNNSHDRNQQVKSKPKNACRRRGRILHLTFPADPMLLLLLLHLLGIETTNNRKTIRKRKGL